jgi:predicted RNA-binding protein with RPS1 domain
VKGVSGKGVTVQLSPSQFGFIELCEITDDLVGNVIDTLALIQPLFVARVIGFDKNQKPILSSRESVVNQKSWELIQPSGKSAHFQKFDDKHQQSGNQRNKILKYGADVALHEGDLCLGYIANIGKSGCFV